MKQQPAPRRRSPDPPKRAAVAVAEPGPRPNPRFAWLYAAGLVVLGFAIYWRALNAGFVFDDSDLFEVSSSVRLRNLWIILTGPRPLLILSFVLNHQLAGGFDQFSFHLVSVVLHIANALILWRVVARIADSPGLSKWLDAGTRRIVALTAPLLFLASPIQTESVAYVSSRSEVLAATFYLLALWVFLSSWRERRPWLCALLIAFLYGCSVTSKQHGLTLPGAILLIDYFFLSAQNWRQLKKNWLVYAVLITEMVVGGFIVVRGVIRVPSAGFYLKDITWKDYLFTQFRMYFLYLRLLLVPFGLNADYDIQPSRTLFQHGAWLALLGLVGLVAAALRFRRRFALASFGLLFFFLTLFPTSSFYPLLDYAAERRLYLASIGFFLVALALVLELPISRHALVMALAAILVIDCAGTWSRTAVWQNGLALWEDTVQKSPRKWRVYTWLGLEYSNRQRFVDATNAYQRALELVSHGGREQAEVLSSLGSTLNNRAMYAQAIPYYQAALKIMPENPRLWTNLAIAELRLGDAHGWQHFQKAIDLNALAWEPHLARGNMYVQMGRYDEAIQDYERVLYLVPDNADARNNLNAARALKQRNEQNARRAKPQ